MVYGLNVFRKLLKVLQFSLFLDVRDEWNALISLKKPRTIHVVDSMDLFTVHEYKCSCAF